MLKKTFNTYNVLYVCTQMYMYGQKPQLELPNNPHWNTTFFTLAIDNNKVQCHYKYQHHFDTTTINQQKLKPRPAQYLGGLGLDQGHQIYWGIK